MKYKNGFLFDNVSDYHNNVIHKSSLYDFESTDEYDVLFNGAIKWHDDCASCWAGPFDGNFAGISVKHYHNKNLKKPLITLSCSMEHHKQYLLYSPYTYVNYLNLNETERNSFLQKGSLTHEEVTEIFENSAYVKWKVEEDIFKSLKYYGEEIYGYASKELPYKIYMYGNDDTSYSKTFASKNETFSVIEKICKNPTMDFLQDELKFVFTN